MSFHQNIPFFPLLWEYRWFLVAALFLGLMLAAIVILFIEVRRRFREAGIGWPKPRLPQVSLPSPPSREMGGITAPLLDTLLGREGGASQDSDDVSGGEGGFNPNWRTLGSTLGLSLFVGLPLFVFYLQGAWPFGPWRGATIVGLPAYWTVFFGMLLLSLAMMPIYVYFIAPTIPGLGGMMPRLTWIIASWAQGATIFDRAADGRYYARPMRKNDETNQAEMWVDGDWQPIPGNIEFVSRLAWKPVAFTWEKSDAALQEIEATDMGEDPVEFLVRKGIMGRDMAEEYQPQAAGPKAPTAAADGGVQYDEYGKPIEPGEAVANGGTGGPYNVLDYRGHAYQAYNPFPNGGDEDEYVIDTRKVMHKLAGAGETNLIQRAKDIALTDTAQTTALGQLVGWMMIGGALVFGVGVAYLTV